MLENSKILITGLTGSYAGSLAAGLSANNEVWGFARFSRPGQLEYWQKAGVHTVVGDCTDPQYPGLPDDFDYVIHSAADCVPASHINGMRGNAEAPARLMWHCRKTKGFLHVSSAAIYDRHPDPEHLHSEEDPVGCAAQLHYEGTKLAGEGAVWAMSQTFGIPAIICRLGLQYGAFGNSGLFGAILRAVVEQTPVYLPERQTNILQPISDDDSLRFMGPLLRAATCPPPIVNLAGDESISTQEIIGIFASEAGLDPEIVLTDAFDYNTLLYDSTRRRELAGDCEVTVREGFVRMFHAHVDRLLTDYPGGATLANLSRSRKR